MAHREDNHSPQRHWIKVGLSENNCLQGNWFRNWTENQRQCVREMHGGAGSRSSLGLLGGKIRKRRAVQNKCYAVWIFNSLRKFKKKRMHQKLWSRNWISSVLFLAIQLVSTYDSVFRGNPCRIPTVTFSVLLLPLYPCFLIFWYFTCM